MSEANDQNCNCRNLLADQDTWEVILDPAFRNDPGAADSLAHLLLVLKNAIASGPEGSLRVINTLQEGIKMLWPYTQEHKLVAMTPAVHSSSVFNPKAGPTEPERAYGGNPAGFVIVIKNGPTIYHSGDTAYFKDMETIGESYAIDVALLNVGGHFGMEAKQAAHAAQSLRAKVAIPHHFGTFPGIAANADAFAAELKKLRIAFYEMKPGETVSFRGKEMIKG